MLNGSAYMRQPWPKGDTYQVTRDDYRGLLFIKPEQLRLVVGEAAKRRWQVTAHTAGEGAMDELLDAYEFVNRTTPIKEMRYCITHANFPSRASLEVAKLGDLIVIDRDVLTCPADDIRGTKVLFTVVGGKVVYEAK